MAHWLKYFLLGVEETAKDAVNTLSKIIELKKQLELKFMGNEGDA